jgi:zinc/manganese transport system permease protein
VIVLAATGGLLDVLGQPFMRNALIGGTAVAIGAGLVGYLLVLRAQVFTGDALSHVAFTSAMAALALGVGLRAGILVGTIGVALLLGLLGPRARADDVVIGSVFAWILGLGVLFLSLYATSADQSVAGAGTTVLFGSILGMSDGQVVATVVATVVVVAVLACIGRPLLFASVDEAVAAARGVPVRALGFVFLALVGLTAAQATQAVGALLLLGLLAAPGAIAQRLTDDPYRAMALSGAVAVGSMWAGLLLSALVPAVPPASAVIGVVSALYALTLVAGGQLTARRLAARERPTGRWGSRTPAE